MRIVSKVRKVQRKFLLGTHVRRVRCLVDPHPEMHKLRECDGRSDSGKQNKPTSTPCGKRKSQVQQTDDE